MSFEPLLFWTIVLFTVTGALIDVLERRVPNWLTVTTSLLGMSFYWLAAGTPGVVFSLQGMLAGCGAMTAMYLVRGADSNDLKLMTAVGALFGAKLTLVIFFIAAVLAALGIAGSAVSGLKISPAKAAHSSPTTPSRSIPYALPAAGAAWLVLAWQLAAR